MWRSPDTGCPEDVVSSLETFKTQLDVGLDTLLWVSLLELGLSQVDPEDPLASAIVWVCMEFHS